MAEKHGNLSINSDNLFPIIKKWLYSDHDIFYRELISNGCDAITKLKKLDMMGEYQLPADYKPQIQIIVNPEEKTDIQLQEELNTLLDESVAKGILLEDAEKKTIEEQIAELKVLLGK